jgi:purine-cytosine permease-like protein
VFVPLFGVLLVDYFLFAGDRWDLGDQAPARWLMLLPWFAGFAIYQFVSPVGISWWDTMWADIASALRFTKESWMSASVLSFALSAVLTLALRLVVRRPATEASTVS